MLFQRASRMFAAVVLVIVVLFDSTQSAVLRNTIESRLNSEALGDKSERKTQLPYEEVSENEVNDSLPVLCLRKMFGQRDCVDKFSATTRGDSSQKCKPNQVLMKGKCYENLKFGFETSAEENTAEREEKLPTICQWGSELVGDKCVDILTTETKDNVSECKSGEVSIKGICFSLDEIASAESSEENFGKLPTVCLRGFELLGGKCVNKFGTDGTESNSSESEDYNENDELAKTINELFKTIESRQNGGKTPEICLRGHVLIGGKCVDLFSLRSGTKVTETPVPKNIPSKINLTEEEALPVICSRNSELIDGKCEDKFEPEELKMGCDLNHVKIGDKCIHRDFDPDIFVFPSQICADDSTWNGKKCVTPKPRKNTRT